MSHLSLSNGRAPAMTAVLAFLVLLAAAVPTHHDSAQAMLAGYDKLRAGNRATADGVGGFDCVALSLGADDRVTIPDQVADEGQPAGKRGCILKHYNGDSSVRDALLTFDRPMAGKDRLAPTATSYFD